MTSAPALAVETLINCAEGRDLLFHARVAVLRALHHDEPDPPSTPRRKQTTSYKVVRCTESAGAQSLRCF